MGCDAVATALIGFRLKTDSLFTLQKVKAFEHNFPDNYKLDPISGKELWRFEWVQHPSLSVLYKGEGPSSCEPSLKGYDVVVKTEYNYKEPERIVEAFVGLSVHASARGSYDIDSVLFDEATIAKVKNDLSEFHDLIEPKSFGLHLICEMSC